MNTETDYAPQIKRRIVKCIRSATGLHERFAARLAETIWDQMCEELRSERIYFSNLKERRAQTNAAVLADWKRSSYRNTAEARDALCRRHGISEKTFYRIIGARHNAD